MVGGIEFRIKKVKGLYYICCKNKGANQLHSYRAAGLRSYFANAKTGFLIRQLCLFMLFLRLTIGQIMAYFRLF